MRTARVAHRTHTATSRSHRHAPQSAASLDECVIRHHLPGTLLDRDMDEATGEIGGGEIISRYRRAPEKWNWTVQLVKDWEAAFFQTPTPNTRKVALRTSLVFSPVPEASSP